MSTETETTTSSKYPSFDGTNSKFRFYKVKMLAYLAKYNYTELMKGDTEIKPYTWTNPAGTDAVDEDTLEKIGELQKKNSKAAGILLDSIVVDTKDGETAFDLIASFQSTDYPAGEFKKMWEALLDMYDSEDRGEVAQQRTKYYALTMENGGNPKKFEVNLNVRRKKLEKNGFRISDDEYIKDLLEKMPKKEGELGVYHQVKKATLKKMKAVNHGVTVGDVVDDLMDIYKEIKPSEEKDEKENGTAFYMKGKQFKGRCRNCGQIGHKISDCPEKKKQDYKPRGSGGYKPRFSANRNNRPKQQDGKKKFGGKCFHCGVKGHKKEDCWKLKKEGASENANVVNDAEEVVFTAFEEMSYCETCNTQSDDTMLEKYHARESNSNGNVLEDCTLDQEAGGDEQSYESEEWDSFWDEFSSGYDSDDMKEILDAQEAYDVLKGIKEEQCAGMEVRDVHEALKNEKVRGSR